MRLLLSFILSLSLVTCSSNIKRGPSSAVTCAEGVQVILSRKKTTLQKARAINDLEGAVKGSFSEIGAGQGISSNFFKAHRASETIVKSISAYGKEESDRLYGAGVRYVSEQRLDQMLEVEFKALKDLRPQFKLDVKIFALGNTVTTNIDGSGHGWIGIRFQDLSKPNLVQQEIKIHVNFGKSNLESQHQELGKLGVNLVHFLFSGNSIPKKSDDLVASLFDGLKNKVINIDTIEWSQGLRKVGMPSVDLIDSEVSDFIIFDSSAKALTGKDLFFRKNVYAFLDGQGNPLDSADINLRMIQWQPLLERFGNNIEKAKKYLRSRIKKGDHVVLLGKNGQKRFLDSLSNSSNTSNKVLLGRDFFNGKSLQALKNYFDKMSESKLVPVFKNEDLSFINSAKTELIREFESRGLLQVLETL